MKPVYQGFVEKQVQQMTLQVAGNAVSSAAGVQAHVNGKMKQL